MSSVKISKLRYHYLNSALESYMEQQKFTFSTQYDYRNLRLYGRTRKLKARHELSIYAF
jgi:hypothetical protein